MRTRFHNVDYRTTSPPFFRLPLPHLPPHSYHFDPDYLHSCFDDILIAPPVIEGLSFHNAHSKFLSDVLPQAVNLIIEDIEITPSILGDDIRMPERNAETLHAATKVENNITFGWKALENGNVPTVVDNDLSIHEFEIPELSLSLESFSNFGKKEMQNHFEFLEIDNNLDVLKPGQAVPYPCETHDSIYSVQDASAKYRQDEGLHLLDEAPQDQFNHSFALLEVDETSLLNFTMLSAYHNDLLPLESFNTDCCTLNDVPVLDDKNLLGSEGIDIYDYFSDNCLFKHHLESQLDFLKLVEENGILSIIELPYIQQSSMINPGSDCDFSPFMKSHIFEELEILDEPCQFFVDIEGINQLQACDQLPMHHMDLHNFDDLIVIHELALVDGTFKSLPIPIMEDSKDVKSLYAIVKKLLSELKPMTLSTSDGIYLDWPLWEQGICQIDVFSTILANLEEMDIYCKKLNQMSADDHAMLCDFIISNDVFNEINSEEDRVSLDLHFEDISLHKEHLSRVTSTKLLDNVCEKPENGKGLSEIGAEKTSLLSESILQFNDLDFFLNPQKQTAGGDTKTGSSLSKPKVSFSVDSFGDTVLPRAHSVQSDQSVVPVYQNKESHNLPPPIEILKDHILEDLLNAVPVETKRSTDDLEIWEKCKDGCVEVPSFKDAVFVVNTQNSVKQMIMSRRSTYNKILALEKDGAQIVERDSILPVDIIITPGTCLLWYNSANIQVKETPPQDDSLSVSSCLDHIAANVLTALSFCFDCCILVFEGDRCFLSAVMEFCDGIYAAAASLAMDIQLFCSHSSDFTDEIILSALARATTETLTLLPKMPESETLAESFLTRFPSLNPLSAHAILSSVATLLDFFRLSHEDRVLATRKYHVPHDCIALFSSLSRYMEREDSKSGITDSSSVSSKSDKFQYERGKRKHDDTPYLNTDKLAVRNKNVSHQIFDQFEFFPDNNFYGQNQNHTNHTNHTNLGFEVRDLDPQKRFDFNEDETIEFDDDTRFSIPNPSFPKVDMDVMPLAQRRVGTKVKPNPNSFSTQDDGKVRRGGETPFSYAVQSGQLKGWPWTMEFLNRVREKSKAYMKPGSPIPRLDYSGNVSNLSKRKSPSTLDLYRYQGGNNNNATPTKNKGTTNRWSRYNKQSKAPKKQDHAAAQILHSWTPMNKRSRQILTFSTNGSGGQSKLAWMPRNSPDMATRLIRVTKLPK